MSLDSSVNSSLHEGTIDTLDNEFRSQSSMPRSNRTTPISSSTPVLRRPTSLTGSAKFKVWTDTSLYFYYIGDLTVFNTYQKTTCVAQINNIMYSMGFSTVPTNRFLREFIHDILISMILCSVHTHIYDIISYSYLWERACPVHTHIYYIISSSYSYLWERESMSSSYSYVW